MKAGHRLSFADPLVAALAQMIDGTLVHKDPEFLALVEIVKVRMLTR